MNLKETDLFKQFSLLLLERNKEHLDVIKNKVSMFANLRLDNSGVMRAFIEYFYDHPELLEELAPYATKYKGFAILEELTQLINENRSAKEIEEKIGISGERLIKLSETHDFKVKKR